MSDAAPPPPAPPPDASSSDGGRPAGQARAYDRVPPHSLEAEVSVLGAALLSKNATSDVTELLRPEDFYRNAHRIVFEGVLALNSAGDVVDTVTLTDWLARQGRLDEVGGAAAVYDLTVAVPTAANAAYYARIVRQKALLRRLIDVGTEVVKLGYDGSDDAESIVDRAESLVYEVAQTGSVSDYAKLGDLLSDSFEQIEKLADQRSEVTGLPTGYNDFDRLTAGLQPQNLIIVAARPAMGKCVTGDTRVLDAATGQLRRIDSLVEQGISEVQVVAVDPAGGLAPAQPTDAVDNGVQPVFELRTRSGRQIRATANHPFLAWSGWAELQDLKVGQRVAVPRHIPVHGTTERSHAEVVSLANRLADGAEAPADSHTKFIPDVAFGLNATQLATFLSRLFATDGSARVSENRGYFGISYCSVSERLIHDLQHLLLRFGILSRIRERQVAYLDGHRRAFELEIRDAENVLRFLDRVGIHAKQEACARVRAHAERRSARHSNTDLLPIEVWDLILKEKGDRSWAEVSRASGRPSNHNWHVGKRQPSRRLIAELAKALDSDALRDVASSDILWDEVVSIEPAGQERVYDLTVPEGHNFVAADMIVHNSSLALGLAHYVTAKIGRPTILFSLEMSKLEIVNRLLSAEARIDSGKLRTGRLDDADWLKLGDALGTLSEAPLFIDDTPSITLNEIRAKCRRLKQKHGLDLVIVDYLQLMQSHRRVDNRQQEVAEISRGLKMLAKEMDAPVIALSQLSRQPESRTDKRPMLADLRESGCLTRQTRLFRADDGSPITFGELIDGDMTDVPVWSSDATGRLVAGRLTHAFASGRKPVFRVRLRSGLKVEASGNHPFRTFDGWTALDDLEVGSRVAAARVIPEPKDPQPMDPDEVVLLAHLIGEGTLIARQPVHYTSADADNLDAVEKAAWNRFGITARRDRDGRSSTTTQLYLPAPYRLTHGRRNPIAAWLDELGLWDRRSYEKHLPSPVFSLPNEQLRQFLRHLWATDGCLHIRPAGQRGPKVSLYYATSSPKLAQDLALLLRRVGLLAVIREVDHAGHRPDYQIWIYGADQQRRFLTEIGIHGERGSRVAPALAVLGGLGSNPNVDVLPKEASDPVLEQLASDDLVWDEIVEIEPLGEREVFDATVEEHHNFVAEGLVLHNSIEQDADIVGFIYRDEVYDEDSPDKGIAELIVAKHRNGATGVVKLAFLNHLTTFANLARNAPGAPGPNGGGGPPTPV